MIKHFVSLPLLFLVIFSIQGYSQEKSYIIRDIKVEGADSLSERSLISTSGLYVGQRISDSNKVVQESLRKLWKMDVFEDVVIQESDNKDKTILIKVVMAPRLKNVLWNGFNKKEIGQLESDLKLVSGKRLTPSFRKLIRRKIEAYFISKNYNRAEVELNISSGSKETDLEIKLDKGQRLKIAELMVSGNVQIPTDNLLKSLKDYRKRLGLIKPFYDRDTEKDLSQDLVSFYKEQGFMDFSIFDSSTEIDDKGNVSIKISVKEGMKYYLRNVNWEGNLKYSSKELTKMTDLTKGIIFNEKVIEEAIRYRKDGKDVSSYYMNDGHLLFHIEYQIIKVENDQVDIRIFMREGKPATIRNIKIEGNDITNQHVILSQLTTFPGDKFDRNELFRSQSALATMGLFDPNTVNVIPVPNPADETVDLTYVVTEQPNDKYELSGTLNGVIGFTGGLGLVLNNFSSKDLFKFKNWKTLPRGDGEKLALRFNSAGKRYNSLNFSYSNPWYNTKNGNTFFINGNYSKLVETAEDENGNSVDGTLLIRGGSVGVSKRIKWPDPYWTWTKSISYNNYKFDDYGNSLSIDKGQTHLITLNNTFARSSINHPFYPSVGSQFSANFSITPPYSLFLNQSDNENPYEFAEYFKFMLDYSKYQRVVGKLTLKFGAHFGLIDNYSNKTPLGPFERFHLGGSGLNGQDIFRGNELIGLRGYPAESLVPTDGDTGLPGGTIFQKLNLELRYPITLNQSYSAYLYGFAEAGNTWDRRKSYNPLEMYKSAGVGMRFSLPFVGQFGIDWAYGFDQLPGKQKPNGGEFHFTIGMPIR